MAAIRGKSDPALVAITAALAEYEAQHPQAEVVAYRHNSVAVRVRIVDPDFRGITKADRHDQIWSFIQNLPEDQQGEISILLCLTPEEIAVSFANEDFENPIPSRL